VLSLTKMMRHQDKCGVLVEYTVGRVCNTRTCGDNKEEWSNRVVFRCDNVT